MTNPYERFRTKELLLRDELAIDRTILANERTALSYFRSALTLVIAGVTFLHFFDTGFMRLLGLIFIPSGILTGTLGIIRFRAMRKSILAIRGSLAKTTPPPAT